MIYIDNLNLKLPRGYESRANDIAHRTAHLLTHYPQSHILSMDKLDLPAISVQGGEANGVIANKIAQAIHQQINAVSRGSKA